VHIVTTASLPWMTGTSVNPLLRAAYLHDRLEIINNKHNNNNNKSNQNKKDKYDTANNNTNTTRSSYVTLVIPWLELPEDQKQLYNGRVFNSTKEQEEYVRDWLLNSANMDHASQNLNIVFYNARYHSDLGSVFAMGDIIQALPQDEPLDVCVLEEPEHVNWFRAPGQGWTKRYNYVVGIVHTNYDQYMKQHYSGLWSAPAIRLISAAMVRAYCHKVIKLSDVVQEFAPEKEITSNVHGVRQEFINMPMPIPIPMPVYYIGKLLWTKGLDLLLEYEEYYKEISGNYFAIDVYGSGPDQLDISRAFLGRDAAQRTRANITQYKVFVNPSVSEVLCTTTAEALAMGKFAIIPVHPSNQFFLRFPNCLGYRNPLEFVANLQWALTHDPTPLTDKVAREFTWEAATDRFLEASSITHREA
ncbi:hypothetical protein FRACYDRAFT_138778, partial [Fragilariopsis cylindrus CCMP1102]